MVALAGCGRLRFDPIPADAVPATGCVAELFANSDTNCARTTEGKLWCWGANMSYEIGDGTAVDQPAPVRVPLATPVARAALGSTHGCAIDTSGTVWCWGTNQSGATGDGTTGTIAMTPVQATVVTAGAYISLAAGAHFTCGVTAAQNVECWGLNDVAQLGDNNAVGYSLTPLPVVGASAVVEVQSASYTTCARETSGAVVCWARNDFGQFGDGTMMLAPDAVATMFVSARSMSTGGTLTGTPTAGHSCVVSTTGQVSCAGANSFGELGDGSTNESDVPVAAGLAAATAVTAGSWHSCALEPDGTVACWGRNDTGQLGRGTTTPFEPVPATIAGLDRVIQIVAGRDQTCALRDSATVACWGDNAAGQVGDGSMVTRSSPADVVVPCS